MLERLAITLACLSFAGAAAAQRGDTLVRVAGAPVHPGIATLREELSIGVADGKPEFMFGEVADIAVGPDGGIVIVDRKGLIVRRYDARGNYLGTLGHRGEGPGEHRTAPGIGFAPNGDVLVWDSGNWWISVFSPSGALRTQLQVPSNRTRTTSSSRGMVVDTAGNAYVRVTTIDIATRTPSRFWVKLRPNGTVADTIPEPEVVGALLSLQATAPGGQSGTSSELPFSARPHVTLSPLGYFVTGFSDRPAFEVHRPGQPIMSVRRPDAKPLPVTAHERDSARARMTEVMTKVDPSWRWGGTDIPRTKPYYTKIFIGNDGRIWLPLTKETLPNMGAMLGSAGIGGGGSSLGPPPKRPDGPPISDAKVEVLYDVYEPTGVYVGQVRIPPRHVLAVTRGDYLWAVAFDDDDVASVKRYRIEWRVK